MSRTTPLTPWNVKYVGDCSFALKRPGKWKTDILGCDRRTDEWYGRADQLEAFLETMPVGTQHPDFPRCWIANTDSADGDAGFASVSIDYAGFRLDTARPAIYKHSKSIQTVSSKATLPNAGAATIEVTFLAPTGELTWFQFSAPGEFPPTGFSRVDYPLSTPSSALVRYSIKPDSGAAISISLADFIAAMNALLVTTQLQEFASEPIIPGQLWHCRTVTVSTLTPA